MVTALDQPSDRVTGLDAGADDFLTKPVSDLVLIGRVRSLARLKMMTDELRMRAVTSKEIGSRKSRPRSGDRRRPRGQSSSSTTGRPPMTAWLRRLPRSTSSTSRSIPARPCSRPRETAYDLAIVSLGLENYDGLRLCSHLRSLERTRNLPLLAIAEAEDNAQADARPRNRRQRLPDPPGRQERAAGAGSHPGQEEALHREAARQRAAFDRGGDHRRADRPA